MHSNPSRRFFLLLSVPLGSGCAAMGTPQMADTVGAGKTRWSAQVLAQRVTEPARLTAPVPRGGAVGVQQLARETAGGSLGYAFRVGPRVRLMPEVAVMLPVGPLPRATELRWEGAKPHVQFGLAFMLDGGGDE